MDSDNISNYFVIQLPHHNTGKNMGEMEELFAAGELIHSSFCKIINLWNHTIKTTININQGKE